MNNAIQILQHQLSLLTFSYVEGDMSTELRTRIDQTRELIECLKIAKSAEDSAINKLINGG